MTILRALPIAALAILGVACGQANENAGRADTTTTSVTAPIVTIPTTVTTSTPTTMTACVPVDTTALQRYLDTTEASIRQTEGAIAQIQLVIDNGTRDRAGALRYQATVQTDYDNAVKTFGILGLDSARDKMTYQEGRLADAKDVVASWDSLLAKARGDLTRAQAQKADFERKVRDVTAQIAAAPPCS